MRQRLELQKFGSHTRLAVCELLTAIFQSKVVDMDSRAKEWSLLAVRIMHN